MEILGYIALLLLIFFVAIAVYYSFVAHHNTISTGSEGIVGQKARTMTKINKDGGKVFLKGEIWEAISNKEIKKGKNVIIVEFLDELTLKVKEAK